jgi:hypothetical protein
MRNTIFKVYHGKDICITFIRKKDMLFNVMIVLFLVMTFIEMTKTEVTENSDL